MDVQGIGLLSIHGLTTQFIESNELATSISKILVNIVVW